MEWEFEIGDKVRRNDTGELGIVTGRRVRKGGGLQYGFAPLSFGPIEVDTTLTLVERPFCQKIKRLFRWRADRSGE